MHIALPSRSAKSGSPARVIGPAIGLHQRCKSSSAFGGEVVRHGNWRSIPAPPAPRDLNSSHDSLPINRFNGPYSRCRKYQARDRGTTR